MLQLFCWTQEPEIQNLQTSTSGLHGSSSFVFQGRCNRDKPPCKYFHPPQHLKDQLLINGRNHLALKNAVLQQVSATGTFKSL